MYASGSKGTSKGLRQGSRGFVFGVYESCFDVLNVI